MIANWNLPKTLEEASSVKVFSGGACNVRDEQGQLLRNVERDDINKWITEKGIRFYDPQIHPDTHGMEYNFEIHSHMEIAARAAASVNIFEISPRTFGGVASMEVALDEFRYHQPTIIFFSDGNNDQDMIPVHTPQGFPIFAPYGIEDNDVAMKAHYEEMRKNANNMRKYLLRYAKAVSALTVTFSNEAYEGDVVITPGRMHAVDIFQAMVNAASGKRVVITFTGGEETRDKDGNPLFIAPDNPPKAQLDALLDQYVDEGNALREAICNLVKINVFVRVVYTQRGTIDALDELLHVKGIL